MNNNDLNLLARKFPLSAATLRRNQMTQLIASDDGKIAAPKESKRVRQDSKPLFNKLEMQWAAMMSIKYPLHDIYGQCIRLRLGNGIWYKPDFMVFREGDIHKSDLPYFVEVKGPHAFRGGFENLKVAASLYPMFNWFLFWKENGEWKQQEILS